MMAAPRLAVLLLLACPSLAAAQGAQVPFGTKHDATAPVEITSDALQLDQAAGTAVFTGTVKVAQGELRLAADRVEVFYATTSAPSGGAAGKDATGKDAAGKDGAGKAGAAKAGGGTGASRTTIERLKATGNVLLSNGTEAAKSEAATYEVATGIVEMTGNVLLTQDRNALSSQSLKIDLNAGTGLLEGRVQTIFTPGAAPGSTQSGGSTQAPRPAP